MVILLKEAIADMAKADQLTRKQALEGKISNILIYLVDAIHQFRIHRLIESFGYPTKKSVGSKTLHLFWLLIQHQDHDVTLQEECLRNCGLNPEDEAFLIDRICVNKGRKQKFGTQFFLDEKGVYGPWPIEDQKKLDMRRKERGLESFSLYAKIMLGNQKTKKKSGK